MRSATRAGRSSSARSTAVRLLREIAMAVFLAASGLATILICGKLFGFDKGLTRALRRVA